MSPRPPHPGVSWAQTKAASGTADQNSGVCLESDGSRGLNLAPCCWGHVSSGLKKETGCDCRPSSVLAQMAEVPLSRVQSIYTSKEFCPSARRNSRLLFDSLSFRPVEPQDCVSTERKTEGAFSLTLLCEITDGESQTPHRNPASLTETSLGTVSQQA